VKLKNMTLLKVKSRVLGNKRLFFAGFSAAFIGVVGFAYFFAPSLFSLSYSIADLSLVISREDTLRETGQPVLGGEAAILSVSSSEEGSSSTRVWADFVASHLPTPKQVRAVYMTSWTAGTPRARERLVRLVEETEINAVVIDIKDYSGTISFDIEHPLIDEIGAEENRISDVRSFIADLHEKNIYVIGRITVFQDPHLAELRPHLAIKKDSDRSAIWVDYKDISYIDPGAREAWDYTVAIIREAYKAGFDELNLDYIRFPSDGNMRDIYFPFSEELVLADPDYGKAKVVRGFFRYVHEQLADTDAVLSADLFGMVTTNADDLNVGQVLEFAEPYFDFIAPMVYPSHYPRGFIGYQSPAEHPYEVVRFSMDRGVAKLLAASSTPEKLRPWLQDFDLGAVYDAAMVCAQIQATYDAGVDSWRVRKERVQKNRQTLRLQ